MIPQLPEAATPLADPAAPAAVAKAVPWQGRQRVPDPRKAWVHVRCTAAEHASLTAAAAQAGLSIGAYVRTTALGTPGVRAARRPAVDRVALARVLGLLGNYTGNLNQVARVANSSGDLPTADTLAQLAAEVATLRSSVMQALGREP